MPREAFIRKWLANKDFQYCEDGRAQMREDLDKVIYHAHQKLNIAGVSGSASGAVDKTVSDGVWCKWIREKRCECEADGECTLM